MINDRVSRDVLIDAVDLKFHLINSSKDFNLNQVKVKLLKMIENNLMIDFFQKCVIQNVLDNNELLIERMKQKFENKMTKLKKELEKTKKEEGEVEIRNVKIKIAERITLSKNKNTSIREWKAINGISIQKRIDILLSILRIALAYEDVDLFKRTKVSCQEQIENSGDWDRRNRFFVYQALYYLHIRNFKEACSLLLKTIPSFIAIEVISFSKMIQYIVLIGIFQLPRIELKKKIIDNPEILQAKDCLSFLSQFLNNFYNCRYSDFFTCLINIMNLIKQDRLLEVHSNFILHQYRFIAYEQFLRPYQSVKLKNMSKEFGLSTTFLEKDLCNYITEGILYCNIDTIDKIITIKQFHSNDYNFKQILKKGDYLISLLKKLSRNLSL